MFEWTVWCVQFQFIHNAVKNEHSFRFVQQLFNLFCELRSEILMTIIFDKCVSSLECNNAETFDADKIGYKSVMFRVDTKKYEPRDIDCSRKSVCVRVCRKKLGTTFLRVSRDKKREKTFYFYVRLNRRERIDYACDASIDISEVQMLNLETMQ